MDDVRSFVAGSQDDYIAEVIFDAIKVDDAMIAGGVAPMPDEDGNDKLADVDEFIKHFDRKAFDQELENLIKAVSDDKDVRTFF